MISTILIVYCVWVAFFMLLRLVFGDTLPGLASVVLAFFPVFIVMAFFIKLYRLGKKLEKYTL